MGLVIFGALAVYVIVLVAVTWFAYRWAAKRGLSRVKRWLVAACGFLAVYLPVFWDHIPTLIAHKYYCEKEAGFWVYKTVEQWKSENPGAAETLTWKALPESSDTIHQADGATRTVLNERIVDETRRQRLSSLPVTRSGGLIVDRKTGQVLARLNSVGSGHGNIGVSADWRALKFWLSIDGCPPALEMRKFSFLVSEYRKMGVQK